MNKRGDITVEAALIIPIILMLVFLFVYVMFAVHDRAVILMKADLLLEKATSPFLISEEKDVHDTETDFLPDSGMDMQEGLFIYRVNNFEIIRNGFFYTVNIDAKARMSISYLIPYFNKFSFFGVHKMHRVNDYCKEKRMMSIVREE